MNNRTFISLAGMILILAGAYYFLSGNRGDSASGPLVEVTVPSLSGAAKLGEAAFNDNCAACHGTNAAGSDKGPPLIHRIYEPNHHGDYSFVQAAAIGVRAHHWKFGNMPPQQQVGEADIQAIIAYVRTLQRANGIF